jgi:hypothetical protein
VTWYGSGTRDTRDGPADTAQFDRPKGVAWTADGLSMVVNQYQGFTGLRFVDFSTGYVVSRFVPRSALLLRAACFALKFSL